MLISPVLLDFMEQALEPIPLVGMTTSKLNNKPSESHTEGHCHFTTLSQNCCHASFIVSSFWFRYLLLMYYASDIYM